MGCIALEVVRDRIGRELAVAVAAVDATSGQWGNHACRIPDEHDPTAVETLQQSIDRDHAAAPCVHPSVAQGKNRV